MAPSANPSPTAAGRAFAVFARAGTRFNQPATLLDELLYEKRFSLWGEIGTVWLDMHHYNKMMEIPRYDALFRIFDVFPIPENECLQRGWTTKGCFQGGYNGITGSVL